MPVIISRGGLSARGAGAFAYITPVPPPPVPPPPGPPPPGPPPPGPVYQTAQFNSSGYWTCPAGVYYVVNLQVYGGMYYSVPDQWVYTTNIYGFYSNTSFREAGNPSGFYTYEQAGSVADSALASINSGGPGERNATIFPAVNYLNPSTGGYFTDFELFSYRVRGVASRASGPWDNRSGQPVRGIGDGWYIGVEVLYPGGATNGTPSSAFGYTAPGGTSPGQQFVTVEGSVAVTPGQQYYIEVGAENGVVVLSFVQP